MNFVGTHLHLMRYAYFRLVILFGNILRSLIILVRMHGMHLHCPAFLQHMAYIDNMVSYSQNGKWSCQ